MTTKVLHFTITGEYMTNFSRELFAEGRYSFAVNEFLCGGLPGLSEKQAIDIITCKKKLIGENELELVPDDAKPEKYGIELSFDDAWERLCNKYIKLNAEISVLQRRIGLLGRQQSPRMALYRQGNSRYETHSLGNDISFYKKSIKELHSLFNDLSFIGKHCGKTFKDLPISFEVYPAGVDENTYGYNDIPISSMLSLGEKREQSQPEIDEYEAEDLVNEFINSQKEIDKKLKDKIVPNPISDLNDASWIAPNGDHYGLNGMIANMLHIQIADKLQEDGIVVVPNSDMRADTFMRQEGWITIHNGWVLYDGFYHGKEITPEQINALYLFGQYYALKTRNIPVFGLKKTPISGARLQMMDALSTKKLFDL